jgi:hypothetical protein
MAEGSVCIAGAEGCLIQDFAKRAVLNRTGEAVVLYRAGQIRTGAEGSLI